MKTALATGLAAAIAITGGIGAAHAQASAQGAMDPNMRHGPGHGPGHGANMGGPWRLIAFKTVGSASDRDTIRISNSRTWRQLQLCSINAPIVMRNFDVVYRNGRTEDVSVRTRIAAGTCTRAIDLRGGARSIRQINLRYDRIQRGMRTPLVRVMGR